MFASKLVTHTVRTTTVALIAGIVSLIAAMLGASPASATTPSVTVRAAGINHPYSCPQTNTFNARILSNGPANVSYHWKRSDGSVGPTRALHFRGAGRHSSTVHDTWQISVNYSGWERLVVTSPNRVETREMFFDTECATGLDSAWATATDSSALCGDVYTDLGGQIFFWGTPPAGVRYYWTVDGTRVGDTTVTDPSVLASGGISPTFHYAFIATAGTTGHSVHLHAETTDGTLLSDSPVAFFDTTCA